LRIISGKYRGKVITAPSHLPVRPTTDFAKTGLFNILQNRVDFSACTCLDLFSGTGSISLEFISRGCKHVTAVDLDQGCINFLKATSSKMGISNIEIIKANVLEFLKRNRQPFNIIFADPPFETTSRLDIHELVFSKQCLANDGIFIMEHLTGENYSHLSGFAFERTYGNVTFSFFNNFDPDLSIKTQL